MEIQYVQRTYIINENEGPVQVCVSAYPVGLNSDNIMIIVGSSDFNHSIYIPSGAALASECDAMLRT